MHLPLRLGLAASFTLALGCSMSSGSQGAPQVAGAADQTTYAARWPRAIETLTQQLSQDEQDARASMASWDAMPGEVAGVHKLDVRHLVDTADRAGQSDGYVGQRRQLDQVRAFYTEDKDEINQKVASTVEYAAQQKGCGDKQLGGAAAYGTKEAFEKRLDKRTKEANEAVAELEEHRADLDKASADKLEKRLEEIASTSYLVHVRTIETRRELGRHVGEAGKVQSTLDKAIERGRSAKSAEAQKRTAELEKQRAAVASQKQAAEAALEGVDERLKQLRKDYDEKLGALKSKLPKGS